MDISAKVIKNKSKKDHKSKKRKKQLYSLWPGLVEKKDGKKKKKKDPDPHQKVSILPFSLKLKIEEIFCKRSWL